MIPMLTKDSYMVTCDALARIDVDLASIIKDYGYPPFWNRPNTYETLVHIILEQQVSLASAKAALEKLRDKIGVITPQNVARLSDEELRAAYFSRQKTVYVKHLTTQILEQKLSLKSLESMSNGAVRETLIQLKGIGNWTVDVYLIMVLHRTDVFPISDIAAINALKSLKALANNTSQQNILAIVDAWKPNRTAATMLLWHYYLSKKGVTASR